MSEYKEIRGTRIQRVTSDPDSFQGGLVWYRTDTNQYKIQQAVPTGAWGSNPSVNTGRGAQQGSAGKSISSAIIFGGSTAAGFIETLNTESYDGTSWTEVNDMNTGSRNASGSGLTTSALCVHGEDPNASPEYLNDTESWNGTNWTSVNDHNTSSDHSTMSSPPAGTSTSALTFGGNNPALPSNYVVTTESWNGTNWTDTGHSLNTGRYYLGSSGTATDVIAIGGYGGSPGSPRQKTESYNGTTWTELNDVGVDAFYGHTANGTSTNALMTTGNPSSNVTLSWNGTNWTSIGEFNIARNKAVGAGSDSTAGLAISGISPVTGGVDSVEIWELPGRAKKIL